MLKLLVFLPRRPDLSPEVFARHLRETHLPLVAQLPGLRRLVLDVAQTDPNLPPPAYDAVAEDWFDGRAALQVALASPAGQAVNADAATFLDLSRLQILVVEEEAVALPTESAAHVAG